MIGLKASAALAFVAVVGLAGCARTTAPATEVAPAAAAINEAVKDRVLAYPGATVTDLRENPGHVVACALLRSQDHSPHVVLAMRNDGDWVVSLPYLVAANSWENPDNRELSDNKRRTCAQFGVEPPADGR